MKSLFIILTLLITSTSLYSQNICELISKNKYEEVEKYTKSLNVYAKSKTTPLMWAIYKSDLKMVKLLISKGAKPKMKSWLNSGSYIAGSNFVLAAWAGKIDILDYFLQNKYFDIDDLEYRSSNTELKNGWNALQTAAFSNKPEVIKYLVEKGAEIDAISESNSNQTALLMAINNGSFEAANELIDLGANVNIRDAAYTSSISLAIAKKQKELVKKIYKKGFKFTENRKDYYLESLKKYFNVDTFEEL
jgi:ankyrin repeat protein